MTFDQIRRQSRWLSDRAADVTSQDGEDGIILAALERLPHRNRWCAEFGAWDGRRSSNTFNLVTSHDYRGVFIESDPHRFQDLLHTHQGKGHILLNREVGFDADAGLDAILQCEAAVPKDLDLLSIDIDGNDYHVWDAIHLYRPKLIVIEYNPTASNAVVFVQPRDRRVSQGSSARALVDLGRRKNYELIAVTRINLVFAEAKYFGLFGIEDNSLQVMRDDSAGPQIFVGYDGHVFLREDQKVSSISMLWHGFDLTEEEVQALPPGLQEWSGDLSRIGRLFYRTRVRVRRMLGIGDGAKRGKGSA
jgi:hypothetical protein